jgi:glyoxylase-like metal-dependent hydrolase (beta-lactamase superfamily II)
VTVECHSIVALFHHPREGWLLWDAGYAPRMFDATRHWPYRLYQWVTPMRLRPELAAAAQLARFGLAPRDVRRVVISHFHADHVAGLRDFPDAQFVAAEAAYADVCGRTGWRALARAFVPALLPDDFERRAELLPTFTGPALGALGPTHDLFGDGSAVMVALPGHARGQVGLLARTAGGPVLFAADACWLSDSYRRNLPPHYLTRLITDDARAMKRTLTCLHQFSQDQPAVAVVPSHCPEAFRRFVASA